MNWERVNSASKASNIQDALQSSLDRPDRIKRNVNTSPPLC